MTASARWPDRIKLAAGRLPYPAGLLLVEGMRLVARPSARRDRRFTKSVLRMLGRPAVVLSGPFEGMHFQPLSLSSQGGVLPKLLGCYEIECTEAIEHLIARNVDVVINVGAAEGYYAVGLLRRLPQARLIAYELETSFHGAIRALGRDNAVVDRLDVRGRCTPAELSASLPSGGRSAVVCDCEGYEDVLLDPATVPALGSSTILVEVHELITPGVTNRLRERFTATHTITAFASVPRDATVLPPAVSLPPDAFDFATDEGRAGPMHWLFLDPKP